MKLLSAQHRRQEAGVRNETLPCRAGEAGAPPLAALAPKIKVRAARGLRQGDRSSGAPASALPPAFPEMLFGSLAAVICAAFSKQVI